MEEIDIIELLQRVKEGEAPKIIEVNRNIYSFIDNQMQIAYLYKDINNDYWGYELRAITLDTKIKILDKPIIEELEFETDEYLKRVPPSRFELADKINEIIRVINKEKENDKN